MKQSQVRIKVTATGVEFVYDDDLLEFATLGETSINRASHVEPIPFTSLWEADMAPVNGPALGPFPNRQMALEAERRWLAENII